MKRAALLVGLLGLAAATAHADVKTKSFPSGALAERAEMKNGVRDGLYEHWADNCQIVERGHYKAGKKDGAWTVWDENGAKQEEGSYVANVRQGPWTFYGPKGEKQTQGPMVDGFAQGTWTEWFASGGKWRTFEMAHGERVNPKVADCEADGSVWKIDYEAGEEGCLAKGKEVGEWTGYYPNGAVRWTGMFVDGYRQGHGEERHPSGEMLHEGEWNLGIPDGTHQWVSASGAVYGTSQVTSGTGKINEFSPAGRHTFDIEYLGGQGHGVWKRYYDNGALDEETTYEAGQKQGPYRRYHLQGELALVGAYAKGARVGAWAEYYENGKVKWAGEFDPFGQKTGLWTQFSYDGQLLSSGMMAEDHESGTWFYFHDTGKLEATGTMEQGMRVGTWQFFWPDGRPWRTAEFIEGREQGPGPKACFALGGAWVSDAKARKLGCEVCRAKPDDEIEQIATGAWTWWHPNGAIEKQGSLDNGKQVGHWAFFYDNSQPMLGGDYDAGKEHGRWEGFYRAGQKRFTGAYEGGNPSGPWTSWYESGAPLSEGRYATGKKSGTWTYYDRTGKAEQVTY